LRILLALPPNVKLSFPAVFAPEYYQEQGSDVREQGRQGSDVRDQGSEKVSGAKAPVILNSSVICCLPWMTIPDAS
jgi:hypothetical protein